MKDFHFPYETTEEWEKDYAYFVGQVAELDFVTGTIPLTRANEGDIMPVRFNIGHDDLDLVIAAVNEEGSRIYMSYSDDSVVGREELPAEVQDMYDVVYGKK